jgi:hypothetical protein
MYNKKIKIYRQFFKDINFSKLEDEINIHEAKITKILKKKKIKANNFGLNFISNEYNELKKILEKIYKFKKFYVFFQSKFILNSCSAVTLNSSKTNYTRSTFWHRDVRYFNKKAKTEMLLLVIPVTDCNKKNGSTIYKLNNKNYQPRLKKGDFLIADARILHKGGNNTSNKPRTIITICITPPHIKPIINFFRLIKNINKKDEYLKQLLGYYSRTPGSFDEFFQKENKRFFIKNQMVNNQ